MPHVGRKMSRRSSILAGGGRRRSSIVGGGGSKTGTTTTTTVPADDGGENAETTTLSAIVALLPRKPKPLGPSTGCNGGKANNNKRRRPPSSSADKTPAGSLQAAAGQLLGAAVPSPSAAAAAGGAADGARGKKRDRAGDADLGDDELQGQKQEQGGIGFNCLPADVTARILFSGYFDTAFVLGRLSPVNKRLHALASDCYHRMDLSRMKLGATALGRLAGRFRSVTHLDLSFCPNIDDLAVIELLKWRRSIRALSLRGCPVTDTGVRMLGCCDALEELDLSKKCMEQTLMITDLGVCGLRTLTRLRRVSLAWNKRLTEDGLAALLLPAAKHRPKRGLQELDLSCCVGLTDGVCELLATQPLERLSLVGCPMLSDAGIRLLALSPPAAHDPTQTPPPSTAVGQPPPTTRGTLRALGLAHCGLLTDGAVEAILQLSVLKELDARDLTLVTTEARSRLQKRWPQALVSCS